MPKSPNEVKDNQDYFISILLTSEISTYLITLIQYKALKEPIVSVSLILFQSNFNSISRIIV